jgi:hypothetical protein
MRSLVIIVTVNAQKSVNRDISLGIKRNEIPALKN